MDQVLTLLLVGLSVGLGNFAAAVAMGLGHLNQLMRLRIALIFGLFETAMPLVGLIIGRQLAGPLGKHANLIGGLILVAAGLYIGISSLKQSEEAAKPLRQTDLKGLMLAAFGLSLDNLIVGFSLGASKESLLGTLAAIGLMSVALALVGLEIGHRLGERLKAYGEIASSLILILVGVAIAIKLI